LKRKTIGLVILLGLISIIGIVVIQLTWVKRSFENQDKVFNDRVHIALTNVNEEILKLNKDSAAITNPVKQVSNNSYVVQMNDTLHPDLLERILAAEFTRNNLSKNFEYGIYDCFTDSIVYGGIVSLDSSTDSISQDITGIKWEGDGHYFGILFPDKSGDVISGMKQWVFTSLILFLVVIFFAYAMIVILRQRRLSDVKTDFINNMTHELKTPISTIGLSSEVLMQDGIAQDPKRLKQYASIIKSENERLQLQVDKVLQIATLDKGEVDLRHESINMHSVIKRAVDTLSVLAQERSGKLDFQLEASESNVRGDRVHLTNVIYNLIDNAIKYASSPKVTVRSFVKQRKLYIAVHDNGIGIKKEDQGRIFDKFYRVSQGNRHDVKGFGLGLYYVKRIVGAHKGKIRVESELQKGATFTIELPLAQP
jgi:two-component system phosphate regulon sensor histidine kinase PhoR